MNVPQPDDDDHEPSHEAITISVTSHLYTAMSVNTGVDSIAKHSVSSAIMKPRSGLTCKYARGGNARNCYLRHRENSGRQPIHTGL